MKRALGRFLLLGLTFLAAGCLEFKEQAMSYRYVQESDELRIFQDYHGIFGGGGLWQVGEGAPVVTEEKTKKLSASDEADLRALLSGQKVFFFSSWLMVFDRESLKEVDEDLPQEVKELYKLLLASVSVRDGAFYLDDEGKLCAVQSVTCEKFSQVVAAVNRCASAFFTEMEKEGSGSEAADRKLLAEARQSGGWKLLEVEGNVLSIRWPLSFATYEEEFGTKVEDSEEIDKMRAAGFGISWKDDVVTFTLGKKDDEITRVSIETSDNDYKPNALKVVRAKHAVKERFDAEAAGKAFLIGKGSGE